ncbi:zinc ribbon domain-containing protein [Sulfobacillus sp. hq2]|uniref:zinc ribbon domain-containing protein n=1 Tax=Sulfobacillus sp. hq2 TaxID=2039167 RepID=UPI000CD00000|nr:zinc ribbon domain-containing protein [Sulfobacillus sp. hq2]POB09689.1 hypothetical protein CO251_15920 [Sulfobacillus sp. hq2]
MPDWKSLKDKAMNAVSNAAQEVDHQLALTKLRAAVNQAQATRDRALARLGQVVYETLQSQGTVVASDATVSELMSQLRESEAQLEAAQRALQQDGGGTNKTACPSCGSPVDPAAKFCATCGQSLA